MGSLWRLCQWATPWCQRWRGTHGRERRGGLLNRHLKTIYPVYFPNSQKEVYHIMWANSSFVSVFICGLWRNLPGPYDLLEVLLTYVGWPLESGVIYVRLLVCMQHAFILIFQFPMPLHNHFIWYDRLTGPFTPFLEPMAYYRGHRMRLIVHDYLLLYACYMDNLTTAGRHRETQRGRRSCRQLFLFLLS